MLIISTQNTPILLHKMTFHMLVGPTLESGIVVPVGITVLVGIFVKNNKHTGWNKRTGGNYHQTKYT